MTWLYKDRNKNKIENNRPTNGNYISNTCCKITINFLYLKFCSKLFVVKNIHFASFQVKMEFNPRDLFKIIFV